MVYKRTQKYLLIWNMITEILSGVVSRVVCSVFRLNLRRRKSESVNSFSTPLHRESNAIKADLIPGHRGQKSRDLNLSEELIWEVFGGTVPNGFIWNWLRQRGYNTYVCVCVHTQLYIDVCMCLFICFMIFHDREKNNKFMHHIIFFPSVFNDTH